VTSTSLFSFDKASPRLATSGSKNDGNGPYWEIKKLD
jgi:hypothetical protein